MNIKNIAFVGIPGHLKKQQVHFDAEAFETPCCHMAVMQDADGNKLIIHKLKSENEKESCK